MLSVHGAAQYSGSVLIHHIQITSSHVVVEFPPKFCCHIRGGFPSHPHYPVANMRAYLNLVCSDTFSGGHSGIGSIAGALHHNC